MLGNCSQATVASYIVASEDLVYQYYINVRKQPLPPMYLSPCFLGDSETGQGQIVTGKLRDSAQECVEILNFCFLQKVRVLISLAALIGYIGTTSR